MSGRLARALVLGYVCTLATFICTARAADGEPGREESVMKFRARVDLGADVGQNFGSLFEARTADGRLVIGAGFMGLYNTMFRNDRYCLHLFVRPASGERKFTMERLPRPSDDAGTYLFGFGGKLYSYSHGEDKTVRWWNTQLGKWEVEPGPAIDRMRLGSGVLSFGDSEVWFNGNSILSPPPQGQYSKFYYASGRLFFYHKDMAGDGEYRAYQADDRGYSKLYACPWSPAEVVVDLSKAVITTLPFVGETPFSYGQLAGDVLTCSNIGGLYSFDGQQWRTLVDPQLGTSYQIYTMVNFYDEVLMGQYPSGVLYEFDGSTVTRLDGSPPRIEGVAGNSREAQTSAIYGGDLYVGVWPWAELWRHSPGPNEWDAVGRMFTHPRVTDKTTHPYERECEAADVVLNQWGQRITSLVPIGDSLVVGTSAKWPCKWEPKFSFVSGGKWQEYGSVIRLRTPGNLSVSLRRTTGPTELEFAVSQSTLRITQNGSLLASTGLAGPLSAEVAAAAGLGKISWAQGVFGRFAGAYVEGEAEWTIHAEAKTPDQ